MFQLRQEILLRQGFRPPSASSVDMGLGVADLSFPLGMFPTGAMHEIVSERVEETVAAGGFVAGLVGKLMTQEGACVWIGPRRNVFPPGLAAFGVAADRVVFVDSRREKDTLWAMEEALKCEGLAAVVGEVRDVSWIASRRFQLVTEQSRVTGFLLRDRPKNRQPIATVASWRVRPVAGGRGGGDAGWRSPEEMPGVGFPKWTVELLKMRSGQPGKWLIEWRDGSFHVAPESARDVEASLPGLRRKTG